MFVAGMPEGRGTEVGHKHFQHAGRETKHFGPRIDRFSFIVLDVSLEALQADASLHRRFREDGKLVTKTVSLGSLDLPDKAIISVAYNTTHYGYAPIGESAPCYGTSGGCGYDSLNVAVTDPASPSPSVGSNPLPDDAYFNSSTGGQYCDGGSGGTGTFRLDSGCWTGYQPVFSVTAR